MLVIGFGTRPNYSTSLGEKKKTSSEIYTDSYSYHISTIKSIVIFLVHFYKIRIHISNKLRSLYTTLNWKGFKVAYTLYTEFLHDKGVVLIS